MGISDRIKKALGLTPEKKKEREREAEWRKRNMKRVKESMRRDRERTRDMTLEEKKADLKRTGKIIKQSWKFNPSATVPKPADKKKTDVGRDR